LSSGADGVSTEEEVTLYRGPAGEIYDPNYRTDRDVVDNTSVGAWIQISKAMRMRLLLMGGVLRAFRPRQRGMWGGMVAQGFTRKGKVDYIV
jgi:hypothetical protein